MATSKRGMQAHIMRVLRNRILRGVYDERLPGQRALASELGTNPQTICVALAQLEAMGLVRRTERQGTFATPPGERSKGGTASYARLVVRVPFDAQGRTELWMGLMIYGFQQACQERKINMVLEYSDSVDSEVEKALRESRTSGCVGTALLGQAVEVRHALRLAQASGPVVLLDWETEEAVVPSVTVDHFDAGRQAVEHLVKLGHRKIALVVREPMSGNTVARRRGVLSYLDNVGMKLSGELICRDDLPLGVEGVLTAPDRPTAVITLNHRLADVLAVLALSRGLRIPQDLSVITFGDGRAFHMPAVTLIASDHVAIGARAVEALLDEDLWTHPRRVLLPVKLADFGTTAPPPGGDPSTAFAAGG